MSISIEEKYGEIHIYNLSECKELPPPQWHWMMEWCKRNMLHPGESWVWVAAEKAYKERKDAE